MSKIAPLSSRALLHLKGKDVVSFLQNLITCDMEKLAVGSASFGALLTPQGKVLFDFVVLHEDQGFILDIDREQRDALAKRLNFYKLRADVHIANDDRSVLAGWDSSTSPNPSPVPAGGFADPRHAGLGWRLFGTSAETNSTEEAWHENRIAQGVPQSGLDFELGSVFPHDVLMDQMQCGGIDFSKGCYVGQEVVSRMQHRGTARNRFVIATAQQVLSPDVTGENLTAGGKRVGTMGSIAGVHGLAIVRVDRIGQALEANTQILAGGTSVELTIPAFATFDWAS